MHKPVTAGTGILHKQQESSVSLLPAPLYPQEEQMNQEKTKQTYTRINLQSTAGELQNQKEMS